MKIERVRICNFRSLEDVTLVCGDIIALVGENNSGKSNIIEALDCFFNPSAPKINEETFFAKDTTRSIQITVEFRDLNTWELENFRPWLCGQKLKVKRVIEWGQPAEIYAVALLRTPQPEWLREDLVTAVKIQEWWTEKRNLRVGDLNFQESLGTSRPTADHWKKAIEGFLLKNGDKIPWIEEERQNPKGYAGVLKGGLPEFIPVQAVRYLAEEAKVGKTNPFGNLLSATLGKVTPEHQTQFEDAVQRVRKLVNRAEGPDRIPQLAEIERRLKDNLCPFVDCDVEIEVSLPDLQNLFSSVRLFVDDGLRTSVEAKGHGLQRSMILAILRSYAGLIHEGLLPGTQKDRSVLFAIEEPELYLHPQAQRVMMQVLRTIAGGKDQVLYSTHSSFFVDIAYFDEICLVRRQREEKHWKTTTWQVSPDSLVTDLKLRHPSTMPTPQSVRERCSHLCGPARCEGFFARKVVLVEGPTEEYALPVFSAALGYDLDREGVSVIGAGAKGQIGTLLRLFNEFRIPCYVVFDGDKDKGAKPRTETNELLEVLEYPQRNPPLTIVEPRFSMFGNDFETTMKEEIPDYTTILSQARSTLGLSPDTGRPLIGRFLARTLVERGSNEGDPAKYIPPTVRGIVEKMKLIRWEKSILKR